MKKGVLWGMGVMLLMVGLVWWQWPKPGVHLTMCDVGQGDALLVNEGFSQLVIDVGPENGGVSSCLGSSMPFWDMFVETVVITHTDSDHMGGLEALLKHYRVGRVITTQVAAARVQAIVNKRSNVTASWQGQEWNFGSISGLVLWPMKNTTQQSFGSFGNAQDKSAQGFAVRANEDTNAQSLVVRLKWGDQSVWFAGDADSKVEDSLIKMGQVVPTKILKVGHHGSASASSALFLAIMQPNQAWISVGKNNRYGHPASEVLKRLSEATSVIRRTDLEGQIYSGK